MSWIRTRNETDLVIKTTMKSLCEFCVLRDLLCLEIVGCNCDKGTCNWDTHTRTT